MKRILLLILSLGFFAGATYAHNGMVHIMGTVTSMSDTSISVKAMNGTMQTIALTSATKYLRGDAFVTPKSLLKYSMQVRLDPKTGDAKASPIGNQSLLGHSRATAVWSKPARRSFSTSS